MRLQPVGRSTRERAFTGGQQEVGHAELEPYAKIVTALFVIANPVGVIPTFISLTGGYSATDKRRTSQVAAATIFIVLVAAAVLGERLLHFFGNQTLRRSGSGAASSFS